MRVLSISAACAAFSAALLAGCSAPRPEVYAETLYSQGLQQEAVFLLKSASEKTPADPQIRSAYLNRRTAFVESSLKAAAARRSQGDFDGAQNLLTRVLDADPQNPRASEALTRLRRDRQQFEALKVARQRLADGDIDQARTGVSDVLADNPDHREARDLRREIDERSTRRLTTEPALQLPDSKPISLEFKDANVRTVFEVLARSTGINFILDKDVRSDLRTTVYLRETPIEEAVSLILQTSQLERKVLNANTVLVYPSTPEKIKTYQDLVVKAFYLRNADAKQVQNTLKTMLKTRDIVIDEKLNLVMMRDTPDAIRLAEKLIAIQDLQEPEVMLELEVMEIQRSKLTDLGVQWPTQLSFTPLSASGGSSLTVNDLRNLNGDRIGASVGGLALNLRKQVTDANILANPRVRVRNREAAKILIGDRLPVVTTNATATGLISENIQYLDVGLKLDAQPDIRLRDDVGIKLSLEVSSIVQQIKTPSGSLAYQIGTRTASTVLQMRDGETQILAGLISDQERSAGSRIPLLGDLPLLNRIFGTQQDNRDKTEIVLSVTPRIVRNIEFPAAGQTEFWTGTEASLRNFTAQPGAALVGAAPSGQAGPTSRPTGGLGQFNPQNVSPTNPAQTVEIGAAGVRRKSMPAKVLSLDWGETPTPRDDGTLLITLKLKADGTVNSLPMQIGFDPNALQVVSVSEGAFFKQGGKTSSFTQAVDVVSGKVFITAGSTDDSQTAASEAALLTLTVKPLGGRPSELRVLAASGVVSGGPPPMTTLPVPLSLGNKP